MSQQINLFNPVFLRQKKVFTARAMGQALAVLVLGMFLLSFMGQRQLVQLQNQADRQAAQLEDRKQRLATATTQFAPREKNPAVETQALEAEAQLTALRGVEGVLRRGDFGSTQGYAAYFRAFAREDMAGLWLTGVSIAGAGTEIGLRGRALEPSLVPAYIGRLAKEDILRGRNFGSLQIGQPDVNAAAAAASGPRVPYVEFNLQGAGAGTVPEAGQ